MSALTIIADEDAPPLALDIPKDQTFDDWLVMGRRLCAGQRVVNWWIGDWWAAGSHRYGERAKAAAEGIFGKEFKTLANAASVCRAFESSRRREALSWSHHAEVAGLDPNKADAILTKAEEEGWSKKDVRRAVMVHRIETGSIQPREDDDPEHTELVGICQRWNRASVAARQSFLEIANDLGAESEIDP